MAMKSIPSLRVWSIMFICLVALLAAACGSVESSPNGPTPAAVPTPAPSPAPGPAPAPVPAPSGPGTLEISINPNPVAWSSNAINGCGSDRPNRWFWDQVLRNTGGSRITLTERVNFFNGDRVSTVSDSITIEPGQSFTKATSWCSAINQEHQFRTDWTGSDAAGNRIAVTGPGVTLRKQ